MDFMGSKKRLVAEIEKYVIGTTVLDACCGSGAVSQHLAKLGKHVIASDLLHFPGTIVRGSIGLTDSQKKSADQFIEYANTLKGKQGFFYNNYSNERTYFLPHNAAFLDHIREEIENVSDSKLKDYLLYCGLEAMSRVQNVCGMQACFLKHFKRTAKLTIFLREEPIYSGQAEFIRQNAIQTVQERKFDTVYIDPPYTERQYGKTYHLYETFIRNDNPEIFGKTGQRKTLEEPSEFCQIYKYEQAFVNFVANCSGRVIISYNSEGNMKKERFVELFSPKVIEMPLPKYNSHGKSGIVSEYLFVIDK
jgi:adenine-specific DNA-methyltransferase